MVVLGLLLRQRVVLEQRIAVVAVVAVEVQGRLHSLLVVTAAPV